jgi:hypothetical protein
MLSERRTRNELLPGSLPIELQRHCVASGLSMVCRVGAGTVDANLDLLLSRRLAAYPPAHSLGLSYPVQATDGPAAH